MIEDSELVARVGAADHAWSTAQGASRQWRRPELVEKAFAEHVAHPSRQSGWTMTVVGERDGGDDESDAISLKTIGTIASFAAPVVGGIIDHFTGQQQSRGFWEGEMAARSLNDLD